MSSELFTSEGKRKYLTADERAAFIAAAQGQPRAEVRTFCETIAQTGCRISEALELTAERIDLSAKAITFRTLKQRGQVRYRAVPIPESLLDGLELVHRIRRTQRSKARGRNAPLWSWGRTQGHKHIKAVMELAGISGPHASAKGLRHGFGVTAAAETRNPRLVQKWLGHRDLKTTAIVVAGFRRVSNARRATGSLGRGAARDRRPIARIRLGFRVLSHCRAPGV